MRDLRKLMKICKNFPDVYEIDAYLPDYVHDFILDYWEELKDAMEDAEG